MDHELINASIDRIKKYKKTARGLKKELKSSIHPSIHDCYRKASRVESELDKYVCFSNMSKERDDVWEYIESAESALKDLLA